MELDEIKSDVENVRIFCFKYYPFLAIPLAYARIVVSDDVGTCGVDDKGIVAVNPKWWMNLKIQEKRFVLMHEVLHLVLLHPQRSRGFNRVLFNVAADAKVNDSIDVLGTECPLNSVSYYDVGYATGVSAQSLRDMSVEEITRLLEKKACKVDIEVDLCDKLDGEEVQKGEFYKISPEDLENEAKSIVKRSEVFAKQAGIYPAGLERAVGEVCERKPPWHIILGMELKGGLKQDSSFAYVSRRGDDYPGPVSYHRKMVVLVDSSGSIGEETLCKFLGIVMHEARNSTVKVIAWDAEAYAPIVARSPTEVAGKVAKMMKGGGGTVIKPALEKALRTMERGNSIIILTDGHISDRNSSEVSRLCLEISRRASAAMVGYTEEKFSPPGFKSFMIW
jgi:predicted metal-dependent peptidase